jgi:FAD:protein FMN transferase
MAINQRNTPAPRAVAASAKGPLERVVFKALGTECEIQFTAPDAAAGKSFAAEAVAWVQAFEAKYSRYRPDSLISRINATASKN